MADDYSTESGGAEATPNESEGQQDVGREDTLFVSPSMIPNADSLKPGAELVFKFIGKDGDGDLELEYAKPSEGEMSLGDELKQAITKG
jgi:hypothetical protein